MSILKFRPQIWSAELLVALRPALRYSGLINHDYEGEIAAAGDTVRITSIGRPTINTYVPNSTTISPEQVNDSQRTLVVDQAKYFAFQVDDVDRRQAAGDVIQQSISEAAFGLALGIDAYIASAYTGVQASNQVNSGALITINSASTPTDMYDKVLIPLRISLDNANVPQDGRTAVITPAMYALLLRDPRFVANAAGNIMSGLESGVVGAATGFSIQVSTVSPLPTANQNVVLAGRSSAYTFAQQLDQVEAYRPQTTFADAVRGLILYGGKLVRPDSWASALVTVS
jgi:hypothetical protein